MFSAEKMSSGERSLTASRGSRPLVLVVAVALLCGLAGVGLKFSKSRPVPAPQLASVPVAVRDLEVGRVVQPSDFYLLRCTPEQLKTLPERNFYSQGKEIVGRIVQKRVTQGHPFGLSSLFVEGTGPSPVDDLASGFRGVTVGVKLVGGVRGFASPNAWVDVLFRRDNVVRPRSIDEARTHTLFHTVQVLAVEDQLYPETQLMRGNHGNVSDQFEITLALTPEQAEVIKTLEGRGTLSLSLLPPEAGRKPMGDLPASRVLDLLLGVVEPEVSPPPPPIAERVEMLRGGQSNMVEIRPDDEIAPSTDDRLPKPPRWSRDDQAVPAPRYPTAPIYYSDPSAGMPMGEMSPHAGRNPEVVYVRMNQRWNGHYQYSAQQHEGAARRLVYSTGPVRPVPASRRLPDRNQPQLASNMFRTRR